MTAQFVRATFMVVLYHVLSAFRNTPYLSVQQLRRWSAGGMTIKVAGQTTRFPTMLKACIARENTRLICAPP